MQSAPLLSTALCQDPDNRVIAEGSAADVLDEIRKDHIDLALYHRILPQKLVEWLHHIPADTFPTGRFLARSDQLQTAVSSVFKPTVLDQPEGQMLLEDIVSLAGRFADVARTDQVDIRLEALTGDACWKFHRDHVALRLVTTYKGPGTEIVPDRFVEEALALQRDYQGERRCLDNQAVALFKGNQHDSSAGVLHRSPPMAGTGDCRFFLCVNLPGPASPDLLELRA